MKPGIDRVLTTVAPDRREFLKRILATAGFVVPVVMSFTLADPAKAFGPSTVAASSAMPTTVMSSTALPTTVVPAATASCLGAVGPLGCWPDAI